MSIDRSVARLQELVRLRTVAPNDDSPEDWSPFDNFIETLERLFPLSHERLTREVIAGHSLLFHWPGSSPGAPAVLMAHYDVVPATQSGWTHPPFGGEITGVDPDRLIWGRGTLDDKAALVAVLEAVEAHLQAGFSPSNDIYLSFGHDEETSGEGATAIAAILESRKVTPSFVLDEGGAVVENVFPGVSCPIAVVGVTEKGVINLTLTVEQEGGHASTPPRRTATARLARAIVRLHARPFPIRLTATNVTMISTLGRHASGIFRLVFSNLWLTKPLVALAFSRLSEETNAVVRTTLAVTMLSSGHAVNALAERAVAKVNVRIAVGSTVDEVSTHIRRAVRDDKVMIEIDLAHEAAPISLTTGPAWDLLGETITTTFANTVVVPYVMLGASDSRSFSRMSKNVYRFSPFEMSKAERGTLHAIDERMHVSSFLRGIEFYSKLISRL